MEAQIDFKGGGELWDEGWEVPGIFRYVSLLNIAVAISSCVRLNFLTRPTQTIIDTLQSEETVLGCLQFFFVFA